MGRMAAVVAMMQMERSVLQLILEMHLQDWRSQSTQSAHSTPPGMTPICNSGTRISR